MQHGHFFGLETLNKEYKEISFQHITVPYTGNDVKKYLETFEWNFNDLIKKSIEKYMTIYLPKYICGFLDKKSIHTDDAELYFGVGDDGKIIGIPFQGDFDINDIIHNTLNTLNISCLHGEEKYDWRKYVSVDILQVEYKERELDKRFTKLDDYEKRKKSIEMKIIAHKRKYMKWSRQNHLYNRKLTDLYKDSYTRNKFLKYLQSHNRYDMVEIVKNFSIEQKSFEEIKDYRLKGSDNIYYWICQWKDNGGVDSKEKTYSRKSLSKYSCSFFTNCLRANALFCKNEGHYSLVDAT